jgi:hypothetical protein
MNYLDNKYSVAYFKLVNRAKSRALAGYVEKHHIIPKSLGGKNTQDNLVNLTAKEHFVCHLLLTKCLEGTEKAKMIYAVNQLSIQKNNHQPGRYVPSGRIYQMIKKDIAKIKSVAMKKNNPMHDKLVKAKHQSSIDQRGKTNGMSGQTHTISTRNKMKAMRSQQAPMSSVSKKNISDRMLQITANPTYINPMDRPGVREKYDKAISVRSANNQKICPHCDSTFTANTYARWHGNNCKRKK